MKKIAFEDKITLFGHTIYHKVRIIHTGEDVDVEEWEIK